MLAASLAAEAATAARRAPGGDPFADLGVSFVEVRLLGHRVELLHLFCLVWLREHPAEKQGHLPTLAG